MTRVLRLTRRSPLLLLAAALVALAVFYVNNAPPASADHDNRDVWSATLTVPGSFGGCNNSSSGNECSSTSALTDDDFRHAGVDYAVVQLVVVNGALGFRLDKAIPAAIRSDGTLHVNDRQFRLANATFGNSNASAQWSNTGLSWPQGTTVQAKLTGPYWTGVDLYGGGLEEHSDGALTLDVTKTSSNTFWVRLTQAPTATVTITFPKLATAFGIDDFDAFGVPETVTFDASNWQMGKTVSVAASEDAAVGDSIIISAAVSIADSADANDPYRNPEQRNGFVVTVKAGGL